MTTTPDERLAQDFALGFLGLMVLFMVIAFMGETTAVSPADHCANVVRTHLSPYQAQQLTEGSWPYTKRAEIVSWCAANPVHWQREIKSARSYPEFPRTTDMIAQ